MNGKMTTMQRRVMRYIIDYRKRHDASPSEREIAAGLKRAHNTIRPKLKWLIAHGWLERAHKFRSLVVKKRLPTRRRSEHASAAR